MINLLEETLEVMQTHGRAHHEITFIGAVDGTEECSWEEFAKLANFVYDNGYGGNEIRHDLIILFSDGTRFSRGEYDGSEWWDVTEPFKRSPEVKPLKNLREA